MRQFAEEIAGKIKGYLPKEYQDMECGVEETRKNNGVYRTGISLCRPGERIGIVIYMEPYEEKYRQGRPLDEIVKDAAAEARKAYALGRTYPIDGLHDFSQIKDQLEPVLINARANRELLRDIPHERLEDLAVAFRTVRFTETGVMSMRVTDKHLEKWGIGKEELKRQAFANVQVSGKYVLQDLKDCLIELFGEGRSEENLLTALDDFLQKEYEQRDPLTYCGEIYALSNRERNYGAAAVLCPEVMEKVDRLFPEGFYLLPSSVHEYLIVRKEEDTDLKGLEAMVREVNRTQVEPAEILSNHVYEYDREKGSICLASGVLEKERGMER